MANKRLHCLLDLIMDTRSRIRVTKENALSSHSDPAQLHMVLIDGPMKMTVVSTSVSGRRKPGEEIEASEPSLAN
jgi:hypothetical protein